MTVAGLMAVVALVAVEAALVRSADDNGLDAFRLFNAAVLVAAAFLARGRPGEAGAFWFGFAAVGWAAFVVVADVSAASSFGGSYLNWIPNLVDRVLSDWEELANSYQAALRSRCRIHLVRLALVLPAGFVGGVVSWFLERRKRRSVV